MPIDPMAWSEAINNSIGYYLWTRFFIDVATGGLIIAFAFILLAGMIKFFVSRME